jgi:hypothetical protein
MKPSPKGGVKLSPSPDLDLARWCAQLATVGAAPEVVPPGWFTVKEIGRAQGKSECVTSENIKKLVKRGGAERKMFSIRLAQKVRPVPHYRLK